MKIIGIGDLVTDYYYKNSKFLGLCGGMTVFNVLANLSKYYETYAIGVCGKDEDGDIAIKSLNDLKVNTNYVERKDILTRCFHVNVSKDGVSSKKRCPVCNRKKWYDDFVDLLEIPKFLFDDKQNTFIFDTINDRNLKLIESIKQHSCKIVIDIGQVGVIEKYEKQNIINNLNGKFNIVQLNERVSNFLMQKFEYDDLKKLNKIFDSDLIIITYGKKGVKFIYNGIQHECELKNPSTEVDPTGAGDLYLSTVIKGVLENNFKITKKILDEINDKATKNTSVIVKKIGARALVQNLYVRKAQKGKCICGLELENDESKKERKKSKKIDTNLSVLKKRIESDLKSNAYEKTIEMIDNLRDISIFCGTGGSFSASYYAAKVVNTVNGIYTDALLPREIMYKNMDSVKNVVTFSYSGTSNDILQVLKKAVKKNKYIVTKGQVEDSDLKVICYRNPKGKAGKERGFLSFEGTLVPASLFAKYYFEKEYKNDEFESFLYERLEYWSEYWKKYFKSNQKILRETFLERNIIDTFYGDYTNTAAIDLESKIVETGTYRITMHEKKNYSHGRFISTEHYNSDVVIYFKASKETMYERKLLKYLKEKSKNLIIIESPYDKLTAEFDLLISVQYLIKNIADLIDKDLSKPAYSEEAMKIYKHQGKL